MSVLPKILNVPLVAMSKNWRFRSERTFFGLNDDYIEAIYEQFFALKHHGGWSFIEAYNLPVGLRNWFFNRLKKHFEDEKKAYEKASKKR